MNVKIKTNFIKSRMDYVLLITLIVSIMAFLWAALSNTYYTKNNTNVQKLVIILFFIPFTTSITWLLIAKASYLFEKFPFMRNKNFNAMVVLISFLLVFIIQFSVAIIKNFYKYYVHN